MSLFKIKHLIWLSLFLIGNSLIYSQDKIQSNNNKVEDEYYHIADSLWRVVKYDSSDFYFEKAAILYKSKSDWNKLVDCYWNIGINNNYLERFDTALSYLNKAIDITNEKIPDKDSILVNIYNSKGTIFYNLGNYNDAFKFYNKTLEISRKRFGDEHSLTGKGFHNVGLIYYRWGDIGKAKEYFEKALSIWLKTLGSKNQLIAYCYTNIANVLYAKGDIKEAVKYDEKALQIWKDRLGENHPFVSFSYNNLASSYQYLGKLNKALNLARKSLAIRLQHKDENHNLAESFEQVGSIFTDMKQFDSAYVYLNKSRILLEQAKFKNHLMIALCYSSFAKLSLKQNMYSKSIDYYDSALTITYPNILSVNSPDEVNYKEIPRNKIFITALSEKAGVYYQRYLHLTHNTENLLNSLLNYQIASRVFEYTQSEYLRDESKFILSKKISDVDGKGLETAFLLYKITHNNNYKNIAFEFAERNKARILLESINESEVENYSNIPDSLLMQEKNIKSKLAFFITKLQDAKDDNDSDLIIENKNKIFEIQDKYDLLKRTFEKEYPEYHKLKYTKNVVKVSTLQNELKKYDALLEYYLFKDKLYVFTIRKNGFYFSKVKLKYPINDLVKSFRNSLSNLDFELYLKDSYDLYNVLIKPSQLYLNNASKIYIIPDGILNYLPFETLLMHKIKQLAPDFSTLPYLIKRYDISYHFSATLLSQMKLHTRVNKNNRFIGIAPVFDDTKDVENRIKNLNNTPIISQNKRRSIIIGKKKYSALPETEKEVREITKLFLGKHKQAEYYLRDKAKEDLLKSDKINQYSFIHLATHGFINETKPKLSGILFTKEEKKEDGILYANEIYNLNLNADLVVLSACESGLGKIVKGEGIIGLTRGFIYSGARNIVVSLWQVADKSTSELMIEFYKNILDGKNFSSSLREAKLKLIKDGTYSYPLEWSPFVLIGK